MEIIKCEACNKEFNSQEALDMHNSAKHPKEEKSKIIKCEACNKEFNSQEALDMHNSAKHPKEEVYKMSRKTILWIVGILALIVLAGYFFINDQNPAQTGRYDEFSKYLTEQGATMYGTEWCSHCKNQKKLFGSSFQYINYVDCDKNKAACAKAGVSSYPTWKINGQNYLGEQSIERLAELSRYQESNPSARIENKTENKTENKGGS